MGRAAELERLRAAADRARSGAAVVLVEADAGGGKSALVEAFRSGLPGWTAALGRCPEVDGAPPGWAWTEWRGRSSLFLLGVCRHPAAACSSSTCGRLVVPRRRPRLAGAEGATRGGQSATRGAGTRDSRCRNSRLAGGGGCRRVGGSGVWRATCRPRGRVWRRGCLRCSGRSTPSIGRSR
ncbi:AAA family ATPase [Pseudonocardia sp. NPDC049154]|uniref:AAA family ATPase n=1 Tax=Pseudonocardia sp. NPDC049154 TaxID=3155501 RepID=UPI0033F45891